MSIEERIEAIIRENAIMPIEDVPSRRYETNGDHGIIAIINGEMVIDAVRMASMDDERMAQMIGHELAHLAHARTRGTPDKEIMAVVTDPSWATMLARTLREPQLVPTASGASWAAVLAASIFPGRPAAR